MRKKKNHTDKNNSKYKNSAKPTQVVFTMGLPQ